MKSMSIMASRSMSAKANRFEVCGGSSSLITRQKELRPFKKVSEAPLLEDSSS
jgi:hypothetical protein